MRVFLLDAGKLVETRRRSAAGDKRFDAALAKLTEDARQALRVAPASVIDKQAVPPSGDKHDYMSRAPYWWPDPQRPGGLPYVRRDGETNPEIHQMPDHRNLGRLVESVETLALAYYFTGEEAYAAHAAKLLRVWFLNPATRMNPHLTYGQGIPGITEGRGIGIIETRGLGRVADAAGLLAGSKAWAEADERSLRRWFAQYLKWLLESQHGKDEAAQKNNHGTWYDVQVAAFALFVGERELAARVVRESQSKRIAAQIEPDGRQPRELARTRAWGYSIFNLQGLTQLAALGEHVGVDLWNYQTADGRGIRRGVEWLAPFALGRQKWVHQEIRKFAPGDLWPLLRRAAARFPDQQFARLMTEVPAPAPTDRSHLLSPGL